jgi:F-type H+-transporting ATPase subunit gamma
VASLKVIRKRITSVRSTQQVTKAMKMVSAAKLRRAQQRAESARAYASKLSELLAALARVVGADAHPLLRPPANAPPHLVLLTADRGLCGAYNASLIRLAERFLAQDENRGAALTACGRRGRDYFRRRGANIVGEHVALSGGFDSALARTLAADLTSRFVSGECGTVYLVYTRFRSAISQQAVVERLLPVAPVEETSDVELDYVYEPDPSTILKSLVPRYVETVLYHAMLEATASEHGARMTAMDSASGNAADMIGRLTLEMNRARQASITKELMEIVGGAEALKG